jgi:hypothetical protein
MRIGSNPPVIPAQTAAQAIGAPSNGLVTTNSLYYQSNFGGFAVSDNFHTPYIQNWNLTVAWQTNASTTVEIGYTGLKGTHLFEPHININGKNVGLLTSQIAQNISTTATINDPLGRLNPATGRVLTVQNGSLGSTYLGFSSCIASTMRPRTASVTADSRASCIASPAALRSPATSPGRSRWTIPRALAWTRTS